MTKVQFISERPCDCCDTTANPTAFVSFNPEWDAQDGMYLCSPCMSVDHPLGRCADQSAGNRLVSDGRSPIAVCEARHV